VLLKYTKGRFWMSQILWTQKQDIGPMARSNFDMVYDNVRGHVVLFGGKLNGGVVNDTWEWDGEEWTQTADIGPSPRMGHALAYDSKRQCVVLFGGRTGTGVVCDTWEWDGENWTQVADTGPSSRYGHAMTFDSKRQCAVLFGGFNDKDPTYGDTWSWDGSEWTQEQDSGPSGRFDQKLVYDSIRDRVTLFGGCFAKVIETHHSEGWPWSHDVTDYQVTYQYLSDTWEYDGTLWVHVADTGPSPRSGHGMIYTGENVLLFGGNGSFGGQFFDDTWSWDGKYWTQRQDMGPSPRTAFGMAYDGTRNRGVLYGGYDSKSGLADTWEQFERPRPVPNPE
jgi:hypothetical protein